MHGRYDAGWYGSRDGETHRAHNREIAAVMNRFCGILIVCLFSCSANCEEMIVISLPSRAGATTNHSEWVVPAKRFLDPKNSWDPESQKLPSDLSRYYGIARSNAITNCTWSSPPELAFIDIRQMIALVGSDTAQPAPVERAVITFYFYDPATAPPLSSLVTIQMLLDGTVAQPRSLRGKRGEESLRFHQK